MKYANLHLHSTYSDGVLTPEQLVHIGKSLGYRALALTDHETDGGVSRFMEVARAEVNNQNGAPLLAADHAKAAYYFKMALERSGDDPVNHLVNNYIRELARAEATGTAPDREYVAKLRILYREWKKKMAMDPGVLSPDESGKVLIPNIEMRLLKAMQEARNPLDVYDQRFEPGKETMALIDQITKEVFYGQSLCTKCCHPASGGDRFCGHCGSKLEFVRGICQYCNEKLKPGVSFCQNCGKSTEPGAEPENKEKK